MAMSQLTEQLSFEGFPVAGSRFALVQANGLVTDQELAYDADVLGSFTGRVRGIRFVERDGSLVRVHEIEIISAEISG